MTYLSVMTLREKVQSGPLSYGLSKSCYAVFGAFIVGRAGMSRMGLKIF